MSLVPRVGFGCVPVFVFSSVRQRLIGKAAPLLFLALVSAIFESPALAQNPPAPGAADEMGILSYMSLHGGDIDRINLSTGGLTLNNPILNYPQRGKLHVSFNLLYNTFMQHFTVTCVKSVCTKSWHPTGTEMLPVEQNDVSVDWAQQVAVGSKYTLVTVGSGSSTSYEYWGYWSLFNADGSSHLLGNLGSFSWYKPSSNTEYQIGNGPWRSLDATGWLSNGALNISTPTGPATPTSVVDPDGVIYSGFTSAYGSPSTELKDPNGNLVTSSATTITDSLGRQIPLPPTASANQRTSTSICPVVNGVSAAYAVPWTPPTYGGGQAQYTFCYATISVNFYNNTTWNVLQSIILPNGQSWQFEYNDLDGTTQYGTLTQVTLPTGGTISYTYTTGGGSVTCQNGGRWVSTRTENANDGTGPHRWTYTYNIGNTVVSDPLGNDTVHTFTALGSCAPYETQTQYYQGSHSTGTLLETVNTTYSYSTGSSSPNTWTYGATNVVPTTITTVWPGGQTSRMTNSYDTGFTYNGTNLQTATGIYGQNISSAVYDYSGSIIKTTNTNYASQSPGPNYATYLSNNLLHLPYYVQVVDGGGTQRSYSYYGYDESALQSSGITEQKTTGEALPGNETSVHRWLNASTMATTNCPAVTSGYLVTNNIYFDTGLVQQSNDPCTFPTTLLYDPAYYGAYPTTVTNALGQSTVYGYDFNTGSVTSVKDSNQQITTRSYDSMDRLIGIGYPDTGSTTYCYTDGVPANCTAGNAGSYPFAVVITKAITSTTNEVSTAILDGMARLSQTQLNSDPSGTTYTLTTYDALGRKSQIYNPTRCSSITSNCASETTWGVTQYNYDELNRVKSVVQQDGSVVNSTYDQTNSGSTGLCTTATDEAGHSRQSCVDGLGRVTGVWEDPGSTGYLNYETDYTYDALSNLTNVNQKGSGNSRARSFQYDSLSQLTSATNPESGTVSYVYDADSNLITKTAPKPNQTGTTTVQTTYAYDKLNRLIKKSYSDGSTPTVQFGYDGLALSGCTIAPPAETDSYPIGRRTAMCDGSGGTEWAHDRMGRINQERRTISAVSGKYGTDTYNLDGSVASVAVLGYTVNFTYNGVSHVITAKNTSDPFSFVTSATYAPFGGLIAANIGPQPITITNAYNDRLQPLLISAAASSTILSLCYDFHLGVGVTSGPCSFSGSSFGDNGNVFQIQNKRDSNRTQNFAYDSLNRISQAYSSGPDWGETYTIDAWGNLTNRAGMTGKNIYEPLSASAGTNNQLSGLGYDTAGNMTSNGTATYAYDAENRLIATAGSTYIYDGDGKRVEKCTEGSTPSTCASGGTGILYWTGPGNDPQAETDLAGNLLENYIFFNGQRIARRDASTKAVHFYFSDHLGTHSLVTDANGDMPPQEESDFYPYGGEMPVTSGDTNHYKFTGKERDSESGLDYFGARHYASAMARFMQPDPFNVIRDAEDRDQFRTYLLQPQNWNHYAYTWNNPLRYVDPTGELVYVVTYTTGNEGGDDKFKKAAETRANEIKNSKGFDSKKDTVIVQGVNSFDSFKNVINSANGMEKQFGKVAEVDLFSHAGERDGPNFNEGTNRPGGTHYTNEQNAPGLESLHINWDASGQAKFFGCYTADFAQAFANGQHVSAYGFDFFSSFSSSPTGRDYRYVFGLGSNLYMTTRDGRPPVRKDPVKPN